MLGDFHCLISESVPASTICRPSGSDIEREHRSSLSYFVEDATDTVRSRGNMAALSHTYSALLMFFPNSRRRLGSFEAGLGSQAPCSSFEGKLFHMSERFDISSFWAGKVLPNCSSKEKRPRMYEMSIETAQKRAYASNCYNLLLSKCMRDEGRREQNKNSDEAATFVGQMATLARADDVVAVSCWNPFVGER